MNIRRIVLLVIGLLLPGNSLAQNLSGYWLYNTAEDAPRAFAEKAVSFFSLNGETIFRIHDRHGSNDLRVERNTLGNDVEPHTE